MKALFFGLILLHSFATASLATTHTINTSGFTFTPPMLTITQGDTVVFVLPETHNVIEVSQSTWDLNGTTPLAGGFTVPFGGGSVVIATLGTHYYVCGVHAGLGMKGTITVEAAPVVLYSSITLSMTADRDGSTGTTSDRVGKRWSFRLYQDSLGSGIVVDSAESALSLLADSLTAGTYVAVVSDSASWTRISQNVDSVSQGNTSQNFRSLTIGEAEEHAIEFIATAPNMIINSGFTFLPETLVVDSGGTVHFVLEDVHRVREVDESAWNANDTTSNGGFELPFSGGTVVAGVVDTLRYVCVPHAAGGMKGVIIVRPLGEFTGSLSDGWNLLSLPVTVDDGTVGAVYPTAVSPAYGYQAGYQVLAEVSSGPGYWVKFAGGQELNLEGLPIAAETVAVSPGWNIIGSVSSPVPASALTSLPGGIVTSAFFGYEGGYYTADTIVPGNGYWVKAGSAGSLIISAAGAAAGVAGPIRIVPTAELPPPPPVDRADAPADVPTVYGLGQNYPNPFNPTTSISYTVAERSHVRLSVFNTLGEVVATLVDGEVAAGRMTVNFDASALSAGVYFYRITAGGFVSSRKMVLLK